MKTLVILLYVIVRPIITVMSHPPRLMVDGNYEGGLTPAACPLGRAFGLLGNCYCTFAHLCSTDLMKEIVPVERN